MNGDAETWMRVLRSRLDAVNLTRSHPTEQGRSPSPLLGQQTATWHLFLRSSRPPLPTPVQGVAGVLGRGGRKRGHVVRVGSCTGRGCLGRRKVCECELYRWKDFVCETSQRHCSVQGQRDVGNSPVARAVSEFRLELRDSGSVCQPIQVVKCGTSARNRCRGGCGDCLPSYRAPPGAPGLEAKVAFGRRIGNPPVRPGYSSTQGDLRPSNWGSVWGSGLGRAMHCPPTAAVTRRFGAGTPQGSPGTCANQAALIPTRILVVQECSSTASTGPVERADGAVSFSRANSCSYAMTEPTHKKVYGR